MHQATITPDSQAHRIVNSTHDFRRLWFEDEQMNADAKNSFEQTKSPAHDGHKAYFCKSVSQRGHWPQPADKVMGKTGRYGYDSKSDFTVTGQRTDIQRHWWHRRFSLGTFWLLSRFRLQRRFVDFDPVQMGLAYRLSNRRYHTALIIAYILLLWRNRVRGAGRD